jgi:hypothetical protein
MQSSNTNWRGNMAKKEISEEIYKVVEAEVHKARALWEIGQELGQGRGGLRDMPDRKVMETYEAIMKARELIQPEFSLEEMELARKIVG